MSSTPDLDNHAFIALGSNLNNPIYQIKQAIKELNQIAYSKLLIYSSLYRSTPLGLLDQPDFINAVAKIKTRLSPYELLSALLNIEKCHGRIRKFPNEPRTLDLDLLLYNDLKYDQRDLILPHPRISQRAFVLKPLLEIEPHCYIPGYGDVSALLVHCHHQRINRITT